MLTNQPLSVKEIIRFGPLEKRRLLIRDRHYGQVTILVLENRTEQL